jgi:hypothetical protein
MLVLAHYPVVLHFDVFDTGAQVVHFRLASLDGLAESSERIVSVLVSVRVSMGRLDFSHLLY